LYIVFPRSTVQYVLPVLRLDRKWGEGKNIGRYLGNFDAGGV